MGSETERRILFVDDEPKVLEGLERMLYPMRQSWQMTFAGSGEQALKLLSASDFDVLVTDVRMPGMTGFELLSRVIKLYPSLTRIVLSGAFDLEITVRSAALAHQFLDKPCQPEALRHAIEHAFKNSYLLQNPALKKTIASMPALPTIPAVYSRLMELLQQPEPPEEEVSRILREDLAITARVLQLANSPRFGAQHPINDVAEAVSRLGTTVVRSLVVDAFVKFEDDSAANSVMAQLRTHGLSVASLSREIAKSLHLSAKDVDICFSGGLLHDVGKMVLAHSFPTTFELLVRRAAEREVSTYQFESGTLGVTHPEVGGYLLWLWGIPEHLTKIVALHHSPDVGAGPHSVHTLIVHVADALVNHRKDDIHMHELEAAHWVDHLPHWQELCGAPVVS